MEARRWRLVRQRPVAEFQREELRELVVTNGSDLEVLVLGVTDGASVNDMQAAFVCWQDSTGEWRQGEPLPIPSRQ